MRVYTRRPRQGSRVFCRHGCARFAWSTRLIRQVITIILYTRFCGRPFHLYYFDFVNGIVLTIAVPWKTFRDFSTKVYYKYYVSYDLWCFMYTTSCYIKCMLLCIIYPKLKSKICKYMKCALDTKVFCWPAFDIK